MAKKSFDVVKQLFKDNNLELVETRYTNNKTPMKYKCNICNYIGEKSYNSLQKGTGCRNCAFKKNSSKRKLNFNKVKQLFKDNNMILLETEYINSKTLMRYKCKKCNLEYKIRYNDLHQNRQCPKCYNNIRGASQKKSFNEVEKLFIKNNMSLLESNYINSSTKMKYKCNVCNYIGYKKYNSLQQGRGCPSCYGNLKKTYKEVKDLFIQNNMELLELEYINKNIPMKYKCNICNYIGTKRYHDLKQGKGCLNCSYINNSGEKNPNWNPDKDILEYMRSKSKNYQFIIRKLILQNNINFKLYKKRYGWLIKDIKSFIKKYKHLKDEKFTADHIIPLSAFIKEGVVMSEKDVTEELIKYMNNINNFQILPGTENYIKASFYLKEDFDNFIKNLYK